MMHRLNNHTNPFVENSKHANHNLNHASSLEFLPSIPECFSALLYSNLTWPMPAQLNKDNYTLLEQKQQ